jgi:hypothetical protein
VRKVSGFVAPATFATNETNIGLRRLLLYETTPLGIWAFFRRASVFPIDQSTGIFAFKKEFSENGFVCINNLGYESPKNIPYHSGSSLTYLFCDVSIMIFA